MDAASKSAEHTVAAILWTETWIIESKGIVSTNWIFNSRFFLFWNTEGKSKRTFTQLSSIVQEITGCIQEYILPYYKEGIKKRYLKTVSPNSCGIQYKTYSMYHFHCFFFVIFGPRQTWWLVIVGKRAAWRFFLKTEINMVWCNDRQLWHFHFWVNNLCKQMSKQAFPSGLWW